MLLGELSKPILYGVKIGKISFDTPNAASIGDVEVGIHENGDQKFTVIKMNGDGFARGLGAIKVHIGAHAQQSGSRLLTDRWGNAGSCAVVEGGQSDFKIGEDDGVLCANLAQDRGSTSRAEVTSVDGENEAAESYVVEGMAGVGLDGKEDGDKVGEGGGEKKDEEFDEDGRGETGRGTPTVAVGWGVVGVGVGGGLVVGCGDFCMSVVLVERGALLMVVSGRAKAVKLPSGEGGGDVEVGEKGEEGGVLRDEEDGDIGGCGLAGGFEAEVEVEEDGGELVGEDGG